MLRLFLSQFILLLTLLHVHAQQLCAQEPAEKLRDGFLLTGKILKRQFREITEVSGQSAVRFLAEERTVALGVVVEADGWIITKASQFKDADRCVLSSGKKYEFEYIGYRSDLDIALVKIEADDLKPIEWETREPAVGQWMITLGTQREPVGVGVMSVPRRNIPASESHGVLGIELERVDEPIIKRVFPNSGAAAAGLKAGDLILEVGGEKITTGRSLIIKLRKHRPGDTLILKYLRGDDTSSATCTLTHPFGDFLSRIAFQNQMGGSLSFRRDNFEAVYQHDTVLKPEDCGGPVINLDGKAYGINIARAGRTKTFVLPADLILSAIEKLKSGELTPPGVEEPTKQPKSPALPEVIPNETS